MTSYNSILLININRYSTKQKISFECHVPSTHRVFKQSKMILHVPGRHHEVMIMLRSSNCQSIKEYIDLPSFIAAKLQLDKKSDT